MGMAKTAVQEDVIYETIVFYPEELLEVPDLLDHLVNHHHEFLKEIIVETDSVVRMLAMDEEHIDGHLENLLCYYRFLTTAIDKILLARQSMLYPYIKVLFDKDLKALVSSTQNLVACGTVISPITAMELENEETIIELEQLRSLSADFTPPVWAGPVIGRFYENLKALEKDLQIYFQKENTILQPKALEREIGLFSA